MIQVISYFARFDATPVSGQSRGLLLVLDAHNDLVASSTVPDYFQVLVKEKLFIKSLKIYRVAQNHGKQVV